MCQRRTNATLSKVDEILGGLRRLPQFRDLPADLLERIAAGSVMREYASGEPIFAERDVGA